MVKVVVVGLMVVLHTDAIAVVVHSTHVMHIVVVPEISVKGWWVEVEVEVASWVYVHSCHHDSAFLWE